jgi:TolA-binding protein
MKFRLSHLAALGMLVLLFPKAAWAQKDEVYLRGEKDKDKHVGTIRQESPLGVKLETKKDKFEEIPTEKIANIYYDKAGSFGAFKADQAVNTAKPDARPKALAEAIKAYENLLSKLDEKTPKGARRHFEFRHAFLIAEASQDDPGKVPLAVEKLKSFRDKYPDGWQITTCIRLLGKMQIATGDYAGAEETYRTLSKLELPDEVKNEGELMAARVRLEAPDTSKIDAAQFSQMSTTLSALASKLGKDTRNGIRARISQAECLAHLGELEKEEKKKNGYFDQAEKELQSIIDQTKDKSIKAQAYNTLGYGFYLKKEYSKARWAFLWVDVVYRQDREEHAKALYYLDLVFTQLNESERAQACRETLQNELAGTEYQKRAASKEKT